MKIRLFYVNTLKLTADISKFLPIIPSQCQHIFIEFYADLFTAELKMQTTEYSTKIRNWTWFRSDMFRNSAKHFQKIRIHSWFTVCKESASWNARTTRTSPLCHCWLCHIGYIAAGDKNVIGSLHWNSPQHNDSVTIIIKSPTWF